MPFIPILLLLLFCVGAVLIAIPLGLVQRYRVGTKRRIGRSWVAALNLLLASFSAAVFLWVAALTNFWLPTAFKSSLLAFGAGLLLGLVGLLLTRWDRTPHGLHYTPNRWLVLCIVAAVAARLIYGWLRGWHAWQTHGNDTSWLAAAGIPGSMAVGAGVLGYYTAYWAGVWWRVRRHRKAAASSRVRSARVNVMNIR